MVLRCFLCKTTYNKDENDIRMHQVPRKEHIMKLWLSVLNIEQINPKAKLCSKHFTEEDFKISVVGERKYLKSDAVPSLNLQKVEKNIGCSSSEKESIQNIQYCNMKHTSLKRSVSIEQLTEEVPLKNIRTITDIDIKKISQSPLEAQECLEVLIKELHEKRKKVKHFRDKVGKLQTTVKNLRSLMKTLKDNKLTSTAKDTLELIESPVLVAVLQKVFSGKQRCPTFPPELKTFAATLHFYSPKAYDFVRRTFMNILPHPSTMHKW